MAVLLIFLLGIGNFALHRAVVESDHPMVGQLALRPGQIGRRVAFGTELVILLVALGLARNGWPPAAWAYCAYSALNGVSAWAVRSGRV